MNILVTGITCKTGIGEYLLEKINLNKNYKIMCIIRNISKINFLKKYDNIEIITGDLNDINSFENKIDKNIDLIIHLAGIQYTLNVIELMIKKRIKKLILISSTNIFSKYKKISNFIKNIETEIINKANKFKFNYIIIRPTMIYGNGEDNNIKKLIIFIDKYPLIPIINNGGTLIQPVFYKDIGEVVIKLIERNDLFNKVYNLSGKDIISYKNLIFLISKCLNKKIILINLPTNITIILFKIIKIIFKSFKISLEQILGFIENRVFDYNDAYVDFVYEPMNLVDGIKMEIEEMRRKGYIK